LKINNKKVELLRAEKGLSLKGLAEKSGLSQSTMTRLSNNTITPRLDTIGKIAKVLDVPVQELFFTEE
jgi:transcriptional regulator with XRE-family HTH domain